MGSEKSGFQYLVSLPLAMAERFEALEGRSRPQWFACGDPPGRQLGSGGGTSHLLTQAWEATKGGAGFNEWLRQSRKLIIHGSGESRRLPAYACVGKPLMPIPAFRWSLGQRLDQTLLDLQLPGYERILAHAPSRIVTLIASGDVLLRFGRNLPPFPEVDVLGLGMWTTPEKAKDFGVFFTPRNASTELSFFLQKPSPARIRELSSDHLCLIDTGMWLLSEKAVAVLLEKSGWDAAKQNFQGGEALPYEFYSQFALALGRSPTHKDPVITGLTSAVVPLPQPEFYHFGTSRQMLESISALQNLELDERKLGLMGSRRHPDQYLQNARFGYPLRQDQNHTLWAENCTIPGTWKLACDHVFTGVPDNSWDLAMEPGVCLDFVPVGDHEHCIRFYGMNDAFRGAVEEANTRWLERPAANWFFARGISREQAGIRPGMDLFDAPLFPILDAGQLDPRWLEWLFSGRPAPSEPFAKRWLECRRVSARALSGLARFDRLYEQRARNRFGCLRPMLVNSRWSVFLKLDLESTARLYANSDQDLPAAVESGRDGFEPMRTVHEHMFRAAVLRHRKQSGWEQLESRSFAELQEMIVHDAQLAKATPRCTVQEDQIVWGRSPVRLDLAGGWTDTPPYCLENGGRVVNLAVDLNGQPPIQVFAKRSLVPELVMRSIDLGIEQRVRTYEELETFAQPGSGFAIAKAAFALAGFLPKFQDGPHFSSLEEQLKAFGGGIEVSLLCAVPKGSGLGTSSILAATLLATIGDLCGLGWDRSVLFTRTLALEQLLTTGGGWQDQAGGIYRGVKLVETQPGLVQKPTLRWLPDHLFDDHWANENVLLYYTGITRLAMGILHEIVRGIFLNSPSHLSIIGEIGENAEAAFNAIQKADYQEVADCIHRSWLLNQRLDSGTNPASTQAILHQIQDYVLATKLLGAGGGGYLLILAKDAAAGRRIRESLERNPPNGRARFVDFRLSGTGLQLTRS
jgi:galactokinase/mevalonate kinase-like predicted kinase